MVPSTLAILASTLIALSPISAKLLRSLPELSTTSYDFIIIGGGTAGSVLANRLTEDGRHTVLVVEAGVDNEGILNAEVPFFAPRQFNTLVDWNYTTVPQSGANGRTMGAARGFALGGSSTLNFMGWTRGSNDVWDNFARLANDDGWSWNSVEKYYLRTSKLVPPQDGRDITGEADPSAHGDGPLNITLTPSPIKVNFAIEDVAKESSGQFAYNLDYNSGNTIGIGWIQFTIGGGIRNSAATGYLQPVINRPNLDVVINTRAVKIMSSSPSIDYPELLMDVVQLASDPNGPKVNVTAMKEIILSAGSLNTPQLLLLSGIGPKEDLKALGIPVVLDSPAVGANLTEHPTVSVSYTVNANDTFDDVLRNPDLQDELLAQWQQNKTGLFASAAGAAMFGIWKLPEGSKDPSSGPKSGNILIGISNGFNGGQPPATGNYISVLTAVVSPTSRGSLKLASSDPFEMPLIDYALYSTDFDINAHVEAIKMTQQFFSLPQFEGLVQDPFGDIVNATTDEAKAKYVRENVNLFAHPCSSASMGPGGVVDSALKVKGVKGLRVVDASIFPQIPEVLPQGLVYIAAERAADLIKGDLK